MCVWLWPWLAAAHWVDPTPVFSCGDPQHKRIPFHWICTLKKERFLCLLLRLYAWVSFHHALGSVPEDALMSWWRLGRKLPCAIGYTLSSPVKQQGYGSRPLLSSPVSSVADLFSLLFLPWALLPSLQNNIFLLILLSLDVNFLQEVSLDFLLSPELVSSGPSPLYSVAYIVMRLHAIHLCICLLCWTVSSMVTRTGASYAILFLVPSKSVDGKMPI